MFGISGILVTIGDILHIVLQVYLWIIIIGALISWVNPDPYNPIVRFLRKATDPLFFWLRRNIPLVMYGIDFSPILAIMLILFVDYTFVPMIREQGNVLANILMGTGYTINSFLQSYLVLVVIAALISFVSPNPYNPIVRILAALTEPVFSWFRRRLPLIVGGLDLTPALVIGIIILMDKVVSFTLIQMGLNLKLKGGL
jgi:YggT family protein